MSTERRAKRHMWMIVGLLLLPIFGCVGIDRIGRGILTPGDGVIVGRVELVGRRSAASGPVLVYLEPSDVSLARLPGVSAPEIRIGAGRQEPQLVLVPPNQPFRFLNLDPIHHEPFSLDAPNDFRVRIGGREPSAPIRLSQSGFVRAFCGLHPSETFALIVSPARHVMAVGRDGSFAIEKVPSGRYRVRAASVDVESQELPVRISRGETVKVQLKLSPRGAR